MNATYKKKPNVQNANSRMSTKLAFRKSSGYLVAHIRLRCSVCSIFYYAYFFLGVGLVCDNALAATDLLFALVLPSRRIDEALLATAFDVCLLLVLAMLLTSSRLQYFYDTLITEDASHLTLTNLPQWGHFSSITTFSFGSSEMSNALRPQLEHFILFGIGKTSFVIYLLSLFAYLLHLKYKKLGIYINCTFPVLNTKIFINCQLLY